MSETLGSINFGNIPVAAPGGISVLGARQGVWNNGGYIELGNTNIGDASTYITNERFIVLSGGTLWAIDLSNYGWRVQSNEVTIFNDGEEWDFMQDGATRSVFRIESLKNERGIQWYNTGAPTGERAFVGWNQTAGGNLILRNNAAILNSGIRIESNGGGDIELSVSGNTTLEVDSLHVTVNGYETISAAFDSPFDITARGISLGFPVPTIRPTEANKVVALDIMPNGSPTPPASNMIAWQDVCDTDVFQNNDPVNCARVGVGTTAIQFGSVAFNGATPKPVQFIVRDVTNVVGTINTDNSILWDTNRFNVVNTSASGDFVGMQLFNSNNGNASSILCVGNQFGTFPNQNFGFIRWNCAGVSPSGTYVNPNQLDVVANSGAVNGMVIGNAEPAPLKFLIHDIVAQFSVDGYFGLGQSITTPTALLHLEGATTARASLLIGSGSAPTAPNDGDIWFDGTDLFMRIGGVTKTFTLV